jgi:hypothetical protein
MKYLLINFGKGNQMVKVVSTAGNNIIVQRFDGGRLMWYPKFSKLKINDTRILKEMILQDALDYVIEKSEKSAKFCILEKNFGLCGYYKKTDPKLFSEHLSKLLNDISDEFK